jgi:hypothetical protein
VSWRKRLVRGLVFAVLAVLAAAGWLYQRLTNPAAVREQVVAKLESQFLHTDVRLESASLRLLGGISIKELRLLRHDAGEDHDLLYVPSGVIYHDKEQLLDGKLAIRKIELQHPRLHFIRDRTGRWNTAQLLGPVDLSEAIPTLVIRQGTIVLEDRLITPDASPVEIRNVNLTVVNDPRTILNIQMRGTADLIGELTASIAVHRDDDGISLTLDAPALPVSPPLIARLGAYFPAVAEHAHQLEGTAQFHAELGYDPNTDPCWTHTARCRLQQGKLNHPLLPLPLDHIDASLQCVDGRVTLEKLTAQTGDALVEAEGSLAEPRADADFQGKLKVTHLPVSAELFTKLPAKLREINEDYSPVGTVNLDLEVSCHAGLWKRHMLIVSKGLHGGFVKFPYMLDKVEGSIEEQCDEEKHLHVRRLDLRGNGSAGRPVYIKGAITGDGPLPEVGIDIWGENLPLDEPLLTALPDKFQKLARSFQPTGQTDFVIRLRRSEGKSEYANHITVRIHDATVRFAVFPYPLENVSGVLEVLPDRFLFRDFRGTHKGGEFRTWGNSEPIGDGQNRVSINIRGINLLLDDELEAALAPKLRAAWSAMSITGRMNVEANVDQLPDRPEDITVAVTTQGCSIRPAFFPYLLSEVAGTVRYSQGKVELLRLSGRHGATTVSLEKGTIFLKPAGGFWARFTEMKGRPLVVDEEFVAALPDGVKKVAQRLAPGTSTGVAAEVIIDMPSDENVPPDIYWDGGISLAGAEVQAGVPLEQVRGQFWCQGRYDGRQLRGLNGDLLLDQAVLFRQPFREIHTRVLITPEAPDVLQMPNLKARIFGGDIGGEVRIEFGPTLRYDVNLTALQVQLEEFGRNNLAGNSGNSNGFSSGNNSAASAQWKGLASGRLYLTGRGEDIQGLEGYGSVDVPSGQMYNLPLLLDLIKVLGMRPPDRTAFEEAHAAFSIHGPRVVVSRLDLDGNAISLSGEGELKLDGTDVQLDFYAVWGRLKQVLPPIFREIPPALGQQLLKIKMRGTVSEPQITKEPVPALAEPLERLIKRFAERSAQAAKPSDGERPAESGWRLPFFGQSP